MKILFNLKEFSTGVGARMALYSEMAGGELTLSAGLAPGSNLGELGQDSVIVVVASDLEEEAPVWWLRVKQAAQRGAAISGPECSTNKVGKPCLPHRPLCLWE